MIGYDRGLYGLNRISGSPSCATWYCRILSFRSIVTIPNMIFFCEYKDKYNLWNVVIIWGKYFYQDRGGVSLVNRLSPCFKPS